MKFNTADIHVRLNDLVSTPECSEKIHIYKSGINKGLVKKVKARPASHGMIGVSKTTLWRWIKDGAFPKPIKLSAGVTVWRMSDIQQWLNEKTKSVVELS